MVAIVTAGDSAIGRHLVLALAGAGHDVAFTHLNAAAMAARLEAEVAALGRKARAWRPMRATRPRWSVPCRGRGLGGAVPEVLVNNAGIQTWASLLDLRAEQWDAVMRCEPARHLPEHAGLCPCAGGGGARRGGGEPGLGLQQSGLSAAGGLHRLEGGIEQFTKVSAVEWGPYGIRVNCIRPRRDCHRTHRGRGGRLCRNLGQGHPAAPGGHAAGHCRADAVLISDAASYVTGQTLWVDGGTFAQANWPYEVTP